MRSEFGIKLTINISNAAHNFDTNGDLSHSIAKCSISPVVSSVAKEDA